MALNLILSTRDSSESTAGCVPPVTSERSAARKLTQGQDDQRMCPEASACRLGARAQSPRAEPRPGGAGLREVRFSLLLISILSSACVERPRCDSADLLPSSCTTWCDCEQPSPDSSS